MKLSVQLGIQFPIVLIFLIEQVIVRQVTQFLTKKLMVAKNIA